MKQLLEHTTVHKEEKAILSRCRDAVKAIDSSAEIILYGSRARQDAAPDSDYDLLIVAEGPASIAQEDLFRRSIYPIELETGAVLTVILVNKADWNSPLYGSMPFYRNIKREGLVL
jgi:predicted nucleotidyltransferase